MRPFPFRGRLTDSEPCPHCGNAARCPDPDTCALCDCAHCVARRTAAKSVAENVSEMREVYRGGMKPPMRP